jgi:hypothetical protein
MGRRPGNIGAMVEAQAREQARELAARRATRVQKDGVARIEKNNLDQLVQADQKRKKRQARRAK